MNAPDLILYNGKITTLDSIQPEVSAVAMKGGRITAIGGEELLKTATDKTRNFFMAIPFFFLDLVVGN